MYHIFFNTIYNLILFFTLNIKYESLGVKVSNSMKLLYEKLFFDAIDLGFQNRVGVFCLVELYSGGILYGNHNESYMYVLCT